MGREQGGLGAQRTAGSARRRLVTAGTIVLLAWAVAPALSQRPHVAEPVEFEAAAPVPDAYAARAGGRVVRRARSARLPVTGVVRPGKRFNLVGLRWRGGRVDGAEAARAPRRRPLEPLGRVPVDADHAPDRRPARAPPRAPRVGPGVGRRGRRGAGQRMVRARTCATCACTSSTRPAPPPRSIACARRVRGAVAGAAGAIRSLVGADASAQTAPARDRVARGLGRRRVPAARRPGLRRGEARVHPPHRERERVRARGLRRDGARHLPLPPQLERLERHRLQLPRRPLRHDLRGPRGRHRRGGGGRAGAGLQQPVDRHREPRHLQHRRPDRGGAARDRAACWAGSWRCTACRPAGACRCVSAGGSTNRYPAGSRPSFERISGHRDGNGTACPGNGLYAQLPQLRGDGGPGPAARRHARPPPAAARRNIPTGRRPCLQAGAGDAAGTPLAADAAWTCRCSGRLGWRTQHSVQTDARGHGRDARAAVARTARCGRAYAGEPACCPRARAPVASACGRR